MVLLSTHNICFGCQRNKKIIFSYTLLSGSLIIRTINGFEVVLLAVNISYFLAKTFVVPFIEIVSSH